MVSGGADTQLGLLGIGVRTPGRTTVVGGSFWQHTMLFAQPMIDPEARLRTLCHTVPGQWMVEGIGFYSGLTMRWFRDAFCAADKRRAAELGVDVYDLLAEDAAGVPPGANGVLGIFSNVMDAKRWIHASPGFVQFDLGAPERSGKNECFRAIQEAAAYVSRAAPRHRSRRSRASSRARSSSPPAPPAAACGPRSWPTSSASRPGSRS